jgi:hypothetical protein
VLAAALEEGGELVGVTFLIRAALDLAKRDLTNKAQSRLPRAAVR